MASNKIDLTKEINVLKTFACKLSSDFNRTSFEVEELSKIASLIRSNCNSHYSLLLQKKDLAMSDLYDILKNENVSFKEMLLLYITVPEINTEKFLSVYASKIDKAYPFIDLNKWKRKAMSEEDYIEWLNREKEYLACKKILTLNYFIKTYRDYYEPINKSLDYNYLCEIFSSCCNFGLTFSNNYYETFSTILRFIPQIPFELLVEFLKSCHFSVLTDYNAIFHIFNPGIEVPRLMWHEIFLKCRDTLLHLSEEQKNWLQNQEWFMRNGLMGGNTDYRLESIVQTYILPAFYPERYPLNDWDPVLKERLERTVPILAKCYFKK